MRCAAGAADLLDEIRAEMEAEGIPEAIRRRETAPLFDWLIAAFSYQGISDRVAFEYMARHGRIRWHAIDAEVRANPSCPKLKNYWQFYDCKFDKLSRTCAEPDHIEGCPLPRHMLRNGRLNRTAYSLYFFIRDIAKGDFVGWIDSQLRRRCWCQRPAARAPSSSADRRDQFAKKKRGAGRGCRSY